MITMTNLKTEISNYFLRLQNQHDITSYDFLQNLVIHLSAKQILLKYNKAKSEAKSFEQLSTLIFTMFDNTIVEDYINAANELMPALARQFDEEYIDTQVREIATTENGLKICSDFLADSKNQEFAFKDFDSKHQIIYKYQDGNVVGKDNIPVEQIIRLIKASDSFELQIISKETNNPKSMYDFKFVSDEMNINVFQSEQAKLFVFMSSQKTVVNYRLADINKKWAIEFI